MRSLREPEPIALDTNARSVHVAPSILRSLDWRFLLPSPPSGTYDHLLLLGGSPGLADAARAAPIADRVSVRLGDGLAFDAVAVLAGARVRLGDLRRHLRPGAAVYLEIDRRRRPWRGVLPPTLRRRVASAGLRPLGVYWAKPGFHRCQMYLPLECPAALNWYVAGQLSAQSAKRHLLRVGLAALARRGSWTMGWVAPTLAVTAIVEGSGTPPISVFGLSDLPVPLRGRQLWAVLLTGGEGSWSRLSFVVFSAGGRVPLAVVKVLRLEALRPWAEREQKVLGQLRDRLDPQLARSLPAPLACRSWGGLTVTVEGYARGRMLAGTIGAWGRSPAEDEATLRHAVGWLARFDLATAQKPLAWDANRAAEFGRLLDRYAATLGPMPAESRLLATARDQAQSVLGLRLPTAWQHADFGPWNVLQDGSDLAVVDWESARLGPVGIDLFYFVTHWLHAARRSRRDSATELADVLELLVKPKGSDRRITAARDAVQWFFAELGIDRRLAGLLILWAFTEQALDRVERLRAVGDPSPESRLGNRYARYVTALAGEPARLFAFGEARWPWSN